MLTQTTNQVSGTETVERGSYWYKFVNRLNRILVPTSANIARLLAFRRFPNRFILIRRSNANYQFTPMFPAGIKI